MDQKKIKHFEEVLLEDKKKLEDELAGFAHKNPNNSDDYQADFPDLGEKEDENAAEVAEFSKNLALEHELEKSLKDVNNALKRIGEGAYSVCRYCEKNISEKRLAARPTSTSCIDCKKLLTE